PVLNVEHLQTAHVLDFPDRNLANLRAQVVIRIDGQLQDLPRIALIVDLVLGCGDRDAHTARGRYRGPVENDFAGRQIVNSVVDIGRRGRSAVGTEIGGRRERRAFLELRSRDLNAYFSHRTQSTP